MISTSEQILRDVPLFAGLQLEGLAEMMNTIELAPGQQLWRQASVADGLYIVVSGLVEVSARLPGQRIFQLATAGPGEVLGELALLEGGLRNAAVSAQEPSRLLSLAVADFRSIVRSRHPGARALRQRLIGLACTRLADRHRTLAAALPGQSSAVTVVRGHLARVPDPTYLVRLPFFREFTPDDLEALLQRVHVEQVAPGEILIAEGEHARASFIVLNGAIEEIIRREECAIRVTLHGPGHAFGYPGIISDDQATASAAARERSLLLVVAPAELQARLDRDPLALAIERDVVRALRQANQPYARLAAGRSARPHTFGEFSDHLALRCPTPGVAS